MGFKMLSESYTDRYYGNAPQTITNVEVNITVPNGNPNPFKFHIDTTYKFGRFVAAIIIYDGCSNYEGKKILVFENLTVPELKKVNFLDPHFSDKGPTNLIPIARFEPTKKGWNMAKMFIEAMNAQE